jgi:hypothetical protein
MTRTDCSFPAEPRVSARRTRGEVLRRAALTTGLLALATIAQLLRQRGHPAWDTVFADDGTGFLTEPWRHSTILLLGKSYAGYLIVLPRILAAPLAILPRSWAAAYLAVVGAVVIALLGWFVAKAAQGLVRRPALCWLLGVALVFAPAMGRETINEISELQFPLVFAAFWAIISVQRSRRMTVSRAAVAFLACTTSPLALLYLPLAAIVAWCRRTRSDLVVTAALGTGGLLQLITLAVVPTPRPLGARTLSGLPRVYLQRVLESWVVGDGWLRTAVLEHRHTLAIVTVLAVAALVVVLAASARRDQWLWAAIAFVSSGAILAVSTWARGLMPLFQAIDAIAGYDGARYFLVPFWLFLSGLVLLAGGAPRRIPRPAAILVGACRAFLILQFVVLAAVGFRLSNARSTGPSYAAELRSAQAQCARRRSSRPVLTFSPPAFYVIVRCDEL